MLGYIADSECKHRRSYTAARLAGLEMDFENVLLLVRHFQMIECRVMCMIGVDDHCFRLSSCNDSIVGRTIAAGSTYLSCLGAHFDGRESMRHRGRVLYYFLIGLHPLRDLFKER